METQCQTVCKDLVFFLIFDEVSCTLIHLDKACYRLLILDPYIECEFVSINYELTLGGNGTSHTSTILFMQNINLNYCVS